ncbi:AraC-type DNA-binding protein [Chitinophaga ginsengisegetis]|uniref:AraC-type DNA-binding protein n=1 Tax=Chitinophaga ginsengisegetis TaxID=393003 RepID=A0A1T5P4V0_9BACT|nr:AraC family transcriptional regulator [Chitinophaga ginsengisegetis]MDR6570370.1 AraC-like DNA-binding protein [Chitinophaga ginsengisegetis]MDR6650104.1 AraC-like DNA-binding protein [Chitinophaga ginsengisegetis]MDR6656255.1 AraC-like DNA-binding protein [Chitinophaga ginsengisegetis]SKD07800.1 AraC-type DNA-binding protein [Chitinophaga ginsengisegetis]
MKQLVLSIIAYAVQRDVDAAQLCKLAGIDLAALKKSHTAPVTAQQLQDLWLNAARLTNDPLFGLHFGESLQPAALGVVGEIIRSSATVGEALTHAAALTHLVTDQCRMEVTRSAKNFTVRLLPAVDYGAAPPYAFRQLIDLLLMMVIHELDGLLLEKIVPQAARLAYTVPDPAEYERVFRCKPSKRVGDYVLVFDSRYWDEPLLTANYELQNLLLQKVSSLPQTAGQQKTLQNRIYNYLLANSYLGVSSLNDMAANFNLSPRSLQRKLKEEGVKYQDIADAVRHSLAVYYISSGNYPLKDISWMLGYNELSAFTRAFKRWTGSSPVQYNQSL